MGATAKKPFIIRILKYLSPYLVICGLWVIFSFPYISRGLMPFPSSYLVSSFPPWNATYGMPVKNGAMPDTISQIYPWKKLTIDSWKRGSIPLWNPFSFSGTPHAANYQSAVFSPVNILFLFLPFNDAWSIQVLLQPVLAGAGMILFLRVLSLSVTATLLGSIAFMFCGFMTTWMAYGTLGYAALCLPWVFWGIASYVRTSGRFPKTVISAGMAFSFLSGHFQISIYVFGAALLYVITESIRLKNIKLGLVLFAHLVLGVLLAAPQLLLTFDAYGASVRSASFIQAEVIPWKYVITLFSPDFYGNPVTRNDWFGHYAEWASYIGIIPLFFSFFSLIRIKNTGKFAFILLAVLALAFAYPTPLNTLLFWLKIPALSTSAASRIILLFSFSCCVLAAYGMDDLLEYWNNRIYKSVLLSIGILAVFIVILWAGLWFGIWVPKDKIAIAIRNSILPTVLIGLSAVITAVGYIRNKSLRSLLCICILLITAFDIYRYAIKWMPFESRAYVYPEVASLKFLNQHIGFDRVFGNIGNESAGVYNLQLIEGYDAMYRGRYAEFINASSKGFIVPGGRSVVSFDKHGLYRSEVLQLLGVRYIYHRISDGRNIWAFPYWDYTDNGTMRQIYHDGDYWIYEYTDAYPRAFLASDVKVIRSDDEIISTLFSSDVNRRETVILEEKPDILPLPGEGKASIIRYYPEYISIETESDAPKILFLSDSYDTGWKATVDGKPVKIYRADYQFRAVEVPQGTHRVEFRYKPVQLTYGAWISFVSLVILIILVIRRKRT